MRLFSFPRVFDFSIFSFSRPSPADRPLATRNFSSSLSPGLCRARPRKASTPRHFFPCRPPADCFLIMFFRCRRSRSRPDGASFSVAFRSLSVSLFPRTFALPVNAAQSPPDFPLRSAPFLPSQSFLRNTLQRFLSSTILIRWLGNPFNEIQRRRFPAIRKAPQLNFSLKSSSRGFSIILFPDLPCFLYPALIVPCFSLPASYPFPFSFFHSFAAYLFHEKETQNFLSPLGI